MAAVPGAVVAVAPTSDARTPENVHQRRSSETTLLKSSLNFRAREVWKARSRKFSAYITLLSPCILINGESGYSRL